MNAIEQKLRSNPSDWYGEMRREAANEIVRLEAALAEEKKWKEEDPRMLREQMRVADVAFQALHERFQASEAQVKELKAEGECPEGNCISATLHNRALQLTKAGRGYDSHLMESAAQYLEIYRDETVPKLAREARKYDKLVAVQAILLWKMEVMLRPWENEHPDIPPSWPDREKVKYALREARKIPFLMPEEVVQHFFRPALKTIEWLRRMLPKIEGSSEADPAMEALAEIELALTTLIARVHDGSSEQLVRPFQLPDSSDKAKIERLKRALDWVGFRSAGVDDVISNLVIQVLKDV